jgi:glycosyltransferase involved in cell wall biosynthesis
VRILLVHNFYQSSAPSGEDVVFDTERQLLERAGHEVVTYTRANDDIDSSFGARAGAAADLFWSRRTYRELGALITRHRPEVAHFHNTFPLVSASGYRACRDAGVPVVQTLHNYRLVCPGALLLRDGKPCEDCIGRLPLPGVQHGCYRGSRTATALLTGMLAVNRARGVYSQDISRYLCLTEFARQRFVRGGLPADRLFVKPNTLLDPPAPGSGEGGYALYIGRLTREKGVHTLIDAWKDAPLPLKVVGDGALRAELEQRARESGAPVEFMGYRQKSEVYELLQAAQLLVIPSECYEGFPVTVLEGLASGTPMLVSRLGAMDELLTEGEHCMKFEAGNAARLASTLQSLLSNPARLKAMRSSNRATFEQHYTAERVITQLAGHYLEVNDLATKSGRQAAPAR